MKRIIKNAVRCKKCGDIIESKFTHDFILCSCKSIGIDGGKDYLTRNLFNCTDEEYEDLSEFDEK